jgi:hypothetical protein
MTEMGEEFLDDEDDVADLITHFELLDTTEKMKKVLDGCQDIVEEQGRRSEGRDEIGESCDEGDDGRGESCGDGGESRCDGGGGEGL